MGNELKLMIPLPRYAGALLQRPDHRAPIGEFDLIALQRAFDLL